MLNAEWACTAGWSRRGRQQQPGVVLSHAVQNLFAFINKGGLEVRRAIQEPFHTTTDRDFRIVPQHQKVNI